MLYMLELITWFWLAFVGLVPVVVAQKLLGRTGEFIIIIMILMAVTSTGSAEVMAVSSILVYDVYQLYLKVIEWT